MAVQSIVQLQKLVMHVVRANGTLMTDPRIMNAITNLNNTRKDLNAVLSEMETKINSPMTAERELNHKIKNRAGSIVMSLELQDPEMTMKMIDNGVEIDNLDKVQMTKVAELVQKHGHSEVALKILNYVNSMKQVA